MVSFIEACIQTFIERKDSETKYANSQMSPEELNYQNLLIEISFVIKVYADSFKL